MFKLEAAQKKYFLVRRFYEPQDYFSHCNADFFNEFNCTDETPFSLKRCFELLKISNIFQVDLMLWIKDL